MFNTPLNKGVLIMVILKKVLIFLAVVFVVIPLLLIGGIAIMPEESNQDDWRHNITGKVEAPAQQEADKPKTRKEQIESLFSKYNGSFRPLERIVQRNMNDPDSYEHVQTKYVDKGDHIVVVMDYRGSNAFGGKVLETIGARYYLESNQIEVVTE